MKQDDVIPLSLPPSPFPPSLPPSLPPSPPFFVGSDYGYMREDGLSGSCVRDTAISLSDLCAGDALSYSKTSGFDQYFVSLFVVN